MRFAKTVAAEGEAKEVLETREGYCLLGTREQTKEKERNTKGVKN